MNYFNKKNVENNESSEIYRNDPSIICFIQQVRTCGYRKATKDCYLADNDHHLESVCQCFEDGCNSAPNLSALSILSTLAAATTLYFVA